MSGSFCFVFVRFNRPWGSAKATYIHANNDLLSTCRPFSFPLLFSFSCCLFPYYYFPLPTTGLIHASISIFFVFFLSALDFVFCSCNSSSRSYLRVVLSVQQVSVPLRHSARMYQAYNNIVYGVPLAIAASSIFLSDLVASHFSENCCVNTYLQSIVLLCFLFRFICFVFLFFSFVLFCVFLFSLLFMAWLVFCCSVFVSGTLF